MTFRERNQYASILDQLSKLKSPDAPPSAAELYERHCKRQLADSISFTDSTGGKDNDSVKAAGADVSLSQTITPWDSLEASEQEPFETAAIEMEAKYREDHQTVQSLSEKLQGEKRAILEKGDFESRVTCKRVSPYRVYKRETAAEIKSEFPLMSNEERS